MVQRKIPDKLGTPAETKNHVKKSDKQKPSSSSSSCSPHHHHQDIRNKGGTEMKKKMKKSRSFKLTESHVRQEKSKLDKPSVLPAATVVTTPQKSTLIKISDMSPNYMKSTSSSDARKERASSVSPRISQTSCDIKSQNKRNSKNSNSSSPSSHKPLKALTKSGTLKPVRTLTKSSSMKAVRPSMKKSSGVGLFPDLNAGSRRATCSSTLKDSKFPDYLKINPGRTESEGTSVMKVCPYTYCSLNGHHHAPSPPLKSFLSSRRRLMKTQKSMRLRCLSPVRTKSGKTKTEIDTGQISFDRDYDAITPQIEETGMDFFVEIYAKARENIDGSNHGGDDKAKNEFTIFPEVQHDILSSITDGAETEAENGEMGFKSIPDDSSHSVSFEEILDQSSDFVIAEVNIFEHDQQVEIEETDYPPTSLVDESVFEATDMDWEEEEVPAELAQNGFNDPGLHELVYKLDDIFSHCSQEVLVNGDELQEVAEEKTETFDMELDTSDSESGGDMMSEIDISSVETDGDTEPDESSLEDGPLQELRAASEDRNIVTTAENDFTQGNLLLEDHEIPCSEVYINPMEEQEHGYLQDEPETDQSLSSGNPYTDAEVGQQLNEPEDLSCGIERQTFDTADSTGDQDLATGTTSPDQLLESGDVKDGAEEKDKVEDANVSLRNNFSDEEGTDAVETCLTNNVTGAEGKKRITNETSDSHHQVTDISSNLKKTQRCKKQIEEDSEELRKFNPRDPNYLPVEPEPEGEKVDLRQQMMDERKNAEEWMLDFALRQAVSKLAPARKRRVALLVEAFETVVPQPKFESRLKHVIPAFTHTWPMQACS